MTMERIDEYLGLSFYLSVPNCPEKHRILCDDGIYYIKTDNDYECLITDITDNGFYWERYTLGKRQIGFLFWKQIVIVENESKQS